MTQPNPLISVVMPVFNAQAYLRPAIESVLAQTEGDFEFIIIDDGSTDQTVPIIRGFQDPRILLLCNERNRGLPHSLNKGLALARGRYIARMDGDDICAKERFEKQVEFMQANPQLAASGTWAIDIDESGCVLGEHRAPAGGKLQVYRLLPSPLIHPTVMLRREMLPETGYDESESQAEDYELWLRLQREHPIGNLPLFLLKYRVHGASRTTLEGDFQFVHSHKLFCRYVMEVDFALFAAILFRSYDVSPVRRWRAMRALARHTGVPARKYWQNQSMYTLKWLADNARKLRPRP